MQKTSEDGQALHLVHTGKKRRLGAGHDRLVSIILPIKNRAHNARALLSRVYAQRCDATIEIIAVDSGSSDDTVRALSDGDATVFTVDPSKFDYGVTRNSAAQHASGDVLVFVTSTMLPADDSWLRHLLEAYDSDETLAGVYSRSIPRPDADVLNYRDYLLADLRTNRQEAYAIRDGLYVRFIHDRDAYAHLPPDRLRQLISFSNVSAAIRPAVFRAIPFRAVSTCGEDMLWAKEVLEAGYKIGHATSSVVLYSHNYSWAEGFRRSFDDSRGSAIFAGTDFADASVVPTILSSVRNDWNYLAHGCQLRNAKLGHWKVQSVVRRCAQVLGQWIGARRDRLSSEPDNLLNAIEGLPGGGRPLAGPSTGIGEADGGDRMKMAYGRIAAGAFRSGQTIPVSEEELLDEIEVRISDDWSRVEASADEDALEVQLDAALRRVAWAVGSWMASMAADVQGFVPAGLSLLESIKGGERISEMRTATLLEASVAPGWAGDWPAFRRVAAAYEAEILAAERELDARAAVMRRMQSDLVHRDDVIRGLQRELHAKVAERDEVIRSLQAEMARNVAERDDVIRQLQLAMRELSSTPDP